MGKLNQTKNRGITIQTSVYLPTQIYQFYKETYQQNGYSSIGAFMRGVLRDHFLKKRLVIGPENIEK